MFWLGSGNTKSESAASKQARKQFDACRDLVSIYPRPDLLSRFHLGIAIMAAHAGETARETGDFHCHSCNEVVHVTKGKRIPECPNGHKTFDTRTGEPGNKNS